MNASRVFSTTILDKNDIPHLAALMELVWPEYGAMFSEEMTIYHQHHSLFHPYFVLAKEENTIVGFAMLMDSAMSTNLLTMSWVAVHPDFQHKGIGTKITESCLAEIKRRRKPVVLSTDVPAFYQPMGFKLLTEYDRETKHFLMFWQPD